MNTWNTLSESNQQRVYKITPAIVKHQIQYMENPTPAGVISLEAAHVDNSILYDYLTCKLSLEEPEIESTDPNIPLYKNCSNNKLHLGMPGGRGDYEDEGDESNEHNAISTASPRRWAATKLKIIGLETPDVDRYEGTDGDDPDAHKEKDAAHAHDGLM